MSDPNTWMNTYFQNMAKLTQVLEDIRTQNDQLTQDPLLITNYFKTDPNGVNPTGGRPRKDIVAQDVTNGQNATVQVLFAYDSGSPPQKASIYKLQP